MSEDPELSEVADGVFAWVQPDGSWGLSNAGLVQGDGSSLLVDTLFDLRLTQRMLDAMSPLTDAAPIGTVVNTHANGDHCFGNQLVDGDGVDFVTSKATRDELAEVPPGRLKSLRDSSEGVLGEFFQFAFGAFDFDGITVPPVTSTFSGRTELAAGNRTVELIEVGPAHTAGDTIVHVPDAATVFTGDILFIGGTPIVWAGPLSNWVAACDLMLELDVDTVVPGHGPVTDNDGIRAVREYLAYVDQEATSCFEAGLDAFDAARTIGAAMGADDRFNELGEAGRIAVNVETAYRALDPTHRTPDVVEQFRRMAALDRA